jgi:hypothetical protein
MSDDLSDEAEVAKALGLDKVIPELYGDLLQPAAKEFGKGLEITAKAINLALAPLQGMVWGSEKIKNYLTVSLTKRLKDIPPEKIIHPKPNIAGPTIESLRFCGHESELRELFINLLAASINIDYSSIAHPAFVEVIKQLTPDEARILKYLSSKPSFPLIGHHQIQLSWYAEKANEQTLNHFIYCCNDISLDSTELIPSYLDNLRRLQLVEITNEYKDDIQDQLDRSDLNIEEIQEILRDDKERIEELFFTSFGIQFIETCVNTNITTNDNG